MTPTISSSVLFNLTTNKLTYPDNTNYSSYGISLSAVDGNLKCTGPTGIFYNNTSWVTPSIDLSSTNTKQVDLPTSGGDVIDGTYVFDYTIRVLTQLSINTTNSGSAFFRVLGDYASLFPALQEFSVVGGGNAGNYSVATTTFYDGTYTKIFVNESIPVNASSEGTINVYNQYTDSQTFSFENCEPVVSIDFTYDCDCSLITSLDTTNYTVNVGGNYYAPETTARVHTVNPPVSPSTSTRVAGSKVSSDATIYYSPIWTTTWTSTIQTTLTYDIEGLIVQKVVTGSASLEVTCSDDLCCAYSCLKNLMDTYESFRNDLVHKERWQTALIQALGWWMVYSVAKSCGQTTTAEEALTNLLAIVRKSGCSCCTDNSAEPVEVIGLCGAAAGTGSGANVVVATCGNGITVTPSTVGTTTTYTVCIDLEVLYGYIGDYLADNPLNLSDLGDVDFTSLGSGDLLRFNGVSWVNVSQIALSQITDFQVSSPTVGQILKWNGSKWVNASNTGNIIEIATTTYTSTGTSTQTLHSVSLDNYTFPSNGDYIDVQSEWVVSNDTNSKTIAFQIGGTDITTPALSLINIGRVLFNFRIIRVSSTQVRMVYSYQTYGNASGRCYPELSGPVIYNDPLNYTVNNMDTLTNTLAFRCSPSAGGSTITLYDYSINSFKY